MSVRSVLISTLFVLSLLGSQPRAQAQAQTPEGLIGVFGDVHGDEAALRTTLEYFKKSGVTYLIGMGDYIGESSLAHDKQLEKILSLLSPLSGVSKDKIFLLPGNWEHAHGMKIKRANEILSRYGVLLTDNYVHSVVLALGGLHLKVSHYPHHMLPKSLHQPPDWIFYSVDQAFLPKIMNEEAHPKVGVDLEIFAHTHIHGSYIDSYTGTRVVNVGTLSESRRLHGEPLSFAMIDGKNRQVTFHMSSDLEQFANSKLFSSVQYSIPTLAERREFIQRNCNKSLIPAQQELERQHQEESDFLEWLLQVYPRSPS